MKSILATLFFALVLLGSCDKNEKIIQPEQTGIEINFDIVQNGRVLKKGETVNHEQNFSLQLDAFKFYVSNIRFVTNNNEEVPLNFDGRLGSDVGVFLFDLGKTHQLLGSIELGEYKEMKFDLGLRPAINDLDPNQFDRAHPLSRNNDMFWDMLKYRFVVIEGYEIDSDEIMSSVMQYHLGGEEFLRNKTFSFPISNDDKTASISILLDWDKIFTNGVDTLEVKDFFSFHSGELDREKGLMMMDFIAESLQK